MFTEPINIESLAATTLALGMMLCAELQAQSPITASPNWNRAMPTGPDTLVKITEVLDPPLPLPAFTDADPLTVEDVRQHLRALQHSAQRFLV